MVLFMNSASHTHTGAENMITSGKITLPNGDTITAGQGGSYGIGCDLYPITIVGWTKSGKTIYYQKARARTTRNSDYYSDQRYLITTNPDAPIKAATWRKKVDGFKPKGSFSHHGGFIYTDGYAKHLDPSF